MSETGESDAPAGMIRSRPETEPSYGIPETNTGMLRWTFIEETMANNEQYWLVTVRPDGRPHARPTWGVWEGASFYCSGGRGSRWVRNIVNDDRVTVHSESATAVVIIEGTAISIDPESSTPERIEALNAAYEDKYGMPHGPPFFEISPTRVLAWNEYPTDATRWVSPGQPD